MNKIINNIKIKSNENKKIYFSFEYFDYKNFDIKISNNFSAWKKFIKKISELTGEMIMDVIRNNQIILEKSDKTHKIVLQQLKNNKFKMKEDFNNNIYDLLRGDFPHRMFGVLDGKKGCFYVLQFDPIHSSR